MFQDSQSKNKPKTPNRKMILEISKRVELHKLMGATNLHPNIKPINLLKYSSIKKAVLSSMERKRN